MDRRPIGVFDSGLGGLTVVKEIIRILPNESIVYLGDTARVPYGPRSKDIVTHFAIEDMKFLIRQGVKIIVIACNTASAYSYEKVKRLSPLPVFDAITPASKKARTTTKNNRVGVIGTWGTIKTHSYKKKISGDSKIKVFEKACPLFVPFIEEGEISGDLIRQLTKKYLSPLKQKNVDTLILGCTHYPIIKNMIKKEVGTKVKLVDPAEELASNLKTFLEEKNLLAPKALPVVRKYFVTDLTNRFAKVAEMFLGKELKGMIKKVTIEPE